MRHVIAIHSKVPPFPGFEIQILLCRESIMPTSCNPTSRILACGGFQQLLQIGFQGMVQDKPVSQTMICIHLGKAHKPVG